MENFFSGTIIYTKGEVPFSFAFSGDLDSIFEPRSLSNSGDDSFGVIFVGISPFFGIRCDMSVLMETMRRLRVGVFSVLL